MIWTMSESVVRSFEVDTPFADMFFVLFGETLCVFLGMLITAFFGFHVYLMLQNMTTIEYCEKKMPKGGVPENQGGLFGNSAYDLGFYNNVCATMGPNPVTWFLPMDPPAGDGLHYVTAESRLVRDMEAGKGIRKKTHQKMQRNSSQRQYPTPTYGGGGGP